MARKTSFLVILALLGMLAFATIAVAQRPNPFAPQAILGTAFTYQGQLKSSGSPYSGACDFQFKLYDASSVGAQIGSTQTASSVSVSSGIFTTQIDFGAGAFDGTARWLDISARCPAGGGSYTALTPRQELTAIPYAQYAKGAPWSGLTGIPAGFADGADNDTTYTAGDGLDLTANQFKMKGTSYQNVIIVAQSGGDFATITAALSSVGDASADNRYLVYVTPGVYTESATMKPYVDIEGAGELTTKITFTGSASTGTGTVVGANDAELRFLTVENTGGAMYAIAINNSGAAPRLTHVSANGIYNFTSYPTINHSVIGASGGTNNYGIYNSATLGVGTIKANNSQLSGSTNSIRNDAEFVTRIGASQLSGGTVSLGGGTVTCAGVYDENYVFYASTCP